MVVLNSHRFTNIALLDLDVNEISKFSNTVLSDEDVMKLKFH